MGNVSTILLQNGLIDKIQKVSKNLLDFGIDILAPACGLSAKTPVRHIKAMTETAGKKACILFKGKTRNSFTRNKLSVKI